MGRLPPSDLRRVLAFLANARIGTASDPIPRPMLVALRELTGADEAEYFELRVADRATLALTMSDAVMSVPGTDEALLRYSGQNPIGWLTGSPADGPQRLSARIHQRDLARLEWYGEFMRPNGLTDNLKVWLWRSPDSIACLHLWRHGGSFSRRDQDVLGVLHHDLVRLRSIALGWEPQDGLDGDGLTAREAEVLVWALRGHARDAIADRLGLSARTVGKHLERAYQELGVRSRAEAIDRLLLSGRTDVGERTGPGGAVAWIDPS
jgi:DNA-binding CsgD family transcriptional regulator